MAYAINKQQFPQIVRVTGQPTEADSQFVLVSFREKLYKVQNATVEEAQYLLGNLEPYGLTPLFCAWYGIEKVVICGTRPNPHCSCPDLIIQPLASPPPPHRGQ